MESIVAKYGDLLRHPRWQKKQTEIRLRDNFTCQHCGASLDDGRNLQVHHIKYIGEFPWDTPDKYLILLCEDCHKHETDLKWCDIINGATNAGITRTQGLWAIANLINHIDRKGTRPIIFKPKP